MDLSGRSLRITRRLMLLGMDFFLELSRAIIRLKDRRFVP
jgi:hypothetical protein